MAKILGYLAGLLAVLSVCSCDVHEFPKEGEPAKVPFTLHLSYATEMPPFKEIIYETRAGLAGDTRYVVCAYRADAEGQFGREEVLRQTFTKTGTGDLDNSVQLMLEPGDYRFIVWTDYVDSGTDADKYYAAGDFEEVILTHRGDYVGNTDLRDAFRGTVDATVAQDGSGEATAEMQRPLAKFRFISTDFDEFITRALEQMAQKEAEKAEAAGLQAPDVSDTRVVDLNSYRVVFRYVGFMPCSINMFTGRPADSWTGIWFEGGLSRLSDTEAEMGFDYVFVNGTESSVSVMVEVHNVDGEVVSSTSTIEVPIKRSMLTTVRGKFLTAETGGNIGIDPDFAGDYNFRVN